MPAYLGLHHGPNLDQMELVAATADPSLIIEVAGRLEKRLEEAEASSSLVRERTRGRLRALQRLKELARRETGREQEVGSHG